MDKDNRAWSTEARLRFIEFRLYWEGRINRGDLIKHFGISVPQASIDLRTYGELAPSNLEYNKQKKAYFAAEGFRPVLITPNAKDYLSQLELKQVESLSPFSHSSFIGEPPIYGIPTFPQRVVTPTILRSILGAIRDRRALEIQYQSMSRLEPTWRWIAPLAIASDGFRWHIRGYCFERQRFSDFVFGRIIGLGSERDSDIDPSNDKEWNNWVEITIGPNPALPEAQRKVIELDYGMANGKFSLEIREALRYYLMRQLGLDRPKGQNAETPQTQHIVMIGERVINRG